MSNFTNFQNILMGPFREIIFLCLSPFGLQKCIHFGVEKKIKRKQFVLCLSPFGFQKCSHFGVRWVRKKVPTWGCTVANARAPPPPPNFNVARRESVQMEWKKVPSLQTAMCHWPPNIEIGGMGGLEKKDGLNHTMVLFFALTGIED